MPEFSLIVATKGRTSELARLIHSIDGQSGVDYELIIVDQNDDDRLMPVIQLSTNMQNIRHIKCGTGVSRARNLGMEHARGKIISFPDDDCWYPPGVMREVADWFNSNWSYDILSLDSRDANGERSGNRWIVSSCDLNSITVYKISVGYGFFMRSNETTRGVRYDEGIGPGSGTQYIGGEDTDFFLELMKRGARGRFQAKWHIGHPRKDIKMANVSTERIYNYGKGAGFVQRKHRLTWHWIALVVFDLGRAIRYLLFGRRKQASLMFQHLRGVISGFLEPASIHGSQ
jgi:glycosyltransferase involved in cell wall biosynthesis